MITGYTGLPRSGKSICLVHDILQVAERNANWKRRYHFDRPIYANFKIKAEINNFNYFKNTQTFDLYNTKGADIFIDEAYKFWNARGWDKLPEQAIHWFAEHDKLGCDIYFGTQEFAMLDIMFRRVTENIWWVERLVGSRRPGINRPPVKSAWGIIKLTKISSYSYNESSKQVENLTLGFIPRFRLIRNKYAQAYDTNEQISV